MKLPDGVATRLPARSHIVAEIHYRGANEPVVDRGTLGLFFNQTKTPVVSSDIVLEARTITPAGAAAQKLRATTRLARDTHVWALRPDLVPGIASIEVSAPQRLTAEPRFSCWRRIPRSSGRRPTS